MLLPLPAQAKKQEETIVESQNKLASEEPVAPLPEPTSPPLAPLDIVSNASGSNNRYRWTPKIVEDKEKKLIWQRADAGQKTLFGAKQYCSQLEINSWHDWRLPYLNELNQLLVGENTVELFRDLSKGMYWSLTALGSRVEFFNPWDRTEHSASVISSSEAHYTLCVRSFTSEFEDSSKVKLFNSLSSSGGASDKSIKSEDTDERSYWTEDFAEDKKQNLI